MASNKVYNILNYIIVGFAALFIMLITTVNLFHNVYITSIFGQERVSYSGKSVSEFVGFIVITLAMILLKKPLEKIKEKYVFLVCILVYLGFGIYFIVNSNIALGLDQSLMWLSATRMLEGDYSTLGSEGYVSCFNNQLGLLALEVVLAKISTDVRVWYGAYLIISAFTNFLMWRSVKLLFNHPLVSKYTIILMTMFLPNFFFVLFMYGNLPGFAMMVCAFYFFLKYIKKHDFKNMIFMAAFVGLSCFFKNNFLISMIAFAILLFIDIFKSHKWKNVLAIVLVVMSFFVCQKGTEWLCTRYFGADFSKTLPLTGYIYIGLNDKLEGMPGWFLQYPLDVFLENDRNAEIATEIVSAELNDRILYLKENPGYAMDFFKRKIIFTWCDQNFMSVSSGPDISTYPMMSDMLNSIYYAKEGFNIVYKFNSMINLIIYFGTLGFIAIKLFVKKETIEGGNIYALIWLVGGFLFHLLWETKSQYVIYYVYFLVPYAGYTLAFIAENLRNKFVPENNTKD